MAPREKAAVAMAIGGVGKFTCSKVNVCIGCGLSTRVSLKPI